MTERAATQTKSERLTLRLSPGAVADISEIAKIYGNVPVSEVIRRAIGTEFFMAKARERGDRLYLADSEEEHVKELVFLR